MSAVDPPPTGDWLPLRVLVVNTHTGLLLLTAVRWLLKRDRYHVVLLQEVSSPVARARLRLVFRFLTWRLVGTRPPSTGRGSSGTIIATRRKRLKHTDHANPLLSAQRFVDGKRDRWHPERRLTLGEYLDRRTRQELTAICAHAWHIRGAPEPVVDEHNQQLARYADAAAAAEDDDRLVILGGDLNEARARGVARDEFSDLRTVSWELIDALFVSAHPHLRVHSVEHIDLTRFKGGEAAHDAISVTLFVKRRR